MILTWHVTLPDLEDGNSVESHFAPLIFALEGMIGVNRWHMARALRRTALGIGAPFPPLYASGIRYQEDPAGKENWRDAPALLVKMRGDCDQLISYRVAELREAGIDAHPVIKWQHLPRELAIQCGYPASWVPEDGLWLVHCLVQFPDGSLEDTSKNLGMGGSFTNRA